MGQQPNIELEISDLPRPEPEPAPARRWSPTRPGEISAPDDMPWGGAFGTTGPDAGYALTLLAARDLPLSSGEDRKNVEVAVATLAAARASRFGRAPRAQDIDVGLLLLGYDESLSPQLAELLAEQRRPWLAGLAGHPDRARELAAAIPVEALEAQPDELLSRLARGEAPIRQ